MARDKKENDDRQIVVWNYPDCKLYTVQEIYGWDGTLEWREKHCDLYSNLMDYETALDCYNNSTASAVRMVRISRYLVDGELVVMGIEKIKVNKQ